MNLQDFRIEPASPSNERDRQDVRDIRQAVFVVEQGVPEELEQDALDQDARYVLARDLSGWPIGCGRLTREHTLGRLAVVPSWRGRGVGRALLHALIEQARALGWSELRLTALASATGFYARDGFVAEGEPFDQAGLPHRTMRRALPLRQPPLALPPHERHALPATSHDQLHAARLQLLQRTRRRLAVQLPRLDAELLSGAAELAELRRIATSGRAAEIRILLHRPAEALRDGHRLILLMQRLPSVLCIRVPVDEVDLASPASCLLNDSGGYLFQPDAEAPQGRAALDDRPGLAPLQQHFDEVWERSVHASMLQPLDL